MMKLYQVLALWTCLVVCLDLASELASAKGRFGEHDYTLQVATATNELTKEQLYEQLDNMMRRLNPSELRYERMSGARQIEITERVVNILMKAKDKDELIIGDLSVGKILSLNTITRDECNEQVLTSRKNICLKLRGFIAFEALCIRANKHSKIWCKEKADEFRRDIVPPEEKIQVQNFSPADKLFQRLAYVYSKHNPAENDNYDNLLDWQKDAIMIDVSKVLKESRKSIQVMAGLNVGEILDLSSIERDQCTKEEFKRRSSICNRLWKRLSLDAYCKRAIETTTKECKRLSVAKTKAKWWRNPVDFILEQFKGK